MSITERSAAADQLGVHEDVGGAARIIQTFSARLNRVLDSAGFPCVNAGRYSALGVKYGVPRQQAHRWCNSQALPGPHVLARIAVDFGTTLDWLFGIESITDSGAEVPLYRLESTDSETDQRHFKFLGWMRFLSSSPTAGQSYAILQNWAESLDPPFSCGEELLVNLGSQDIEDGACYVIRTASSTSVRKATILPDGASVMFFCKTPINTYTSTFRVDEIHLNESRQFETDWRQPGALLLGRIDATTRSLLPRVHSFFSS